MPTISILVSGKVQGVFYRQSSREKAKSLGIQGSVENKKDGTVFIIATGNSNQLDELISWCRQGPLAAVVETLKIEELPDQEFRRFSIIR